MGETVASVTQWARTQDFIDEDFKMENNKIKNGQHGPRTDDYPDVRSYYTAPTTPMSDCGVLGKRSRPTLLTGFPNDYWYHADSNWDSSPPHGVSNEDKVVESTRTSLSYGACVQREHSQYTQGPQYEHGARRHYGPSEYNVSVSTANNGPPALHASYPFHGPPEQHHAANQPAAPIDAGVDEHGIHGASFSGMHAHVVPVFGNTFSSNRVHIPPLPGFEHVVPHDGVCLRLPPGFEGHPSQIRTDLRPQRGSEGADPQNGAELRPSGFATPYNQWERNSSCWSMAAVNGAIQLQELMARFPNFNMSRLITASDREDRVWFAPAPVELFRQTPKPVFLAPSHAEHLASFYTGTALARRTRSERVASDCAENRLWKTGIHSHQAAMTYYETDM